MNLNRFPSVDKRPLDLYELKKAVESRGGFERVCKGKKWAEIGRILGYSGKIMSSLSTSLKNSYAKWLEPYERFCAGAKPAVQWQMEQERGGPYGTPSPVPSPLKKSSHATPSSLGKESPAIRASQVFNENVDLNPMQFSRPLFNINPEPSRPASGFTAVNASPAPSGFTAINSQSQFQLIPGGPHPATNGINGHGSPPYAPNGYAPHEMKRSFSESVDNDSAPNIDEASRESKRPKKEGPPTVTGSYMGQSRTSGSQALGAKERNNWGPGDYCEICGKGDDDQNILLCESCHSGSHTYCLDPPLTSVPDNDWHCPKCLVGTGEFGFEEGGTYSLKQFQERAYWFKENHFRSRTPFDPILDRPRAPTEPDIEKEFWRLVSSLTETVEVEYGADIHSTTHGSGFPTIETHPRDPYSLEPWNLNVLPLHNESLFQYIKSDISGMTVPWLYVGMVFSTFCWHNEDHYTYSANYQHFGDTKTWYGIPGEDAERFEEAMRNAVPELFEKQPDLLFQLVTLLSPEQLQKAGVNVYAVDQRAGQMVITFPQAYHAGFNHGFNFNEAVNFAPSDWEPFGQRDVDRLRDFRRQPAFSHDELLLTAAAGRDVTIKMAKWLAPALKRMLAREKTNRATFDARVEEGKYYRPRDEEDFRYQFERMTDNEDLHEDAYICTYCKGFAYLSRFVCGNAKMVACLDHIAAVDCCSTQAGHALHIRTTTYRLEQTVQKVSDKARSPDVWTDKFEAAISESPKPQLKVLRTLLGEGERIPWPLSQLSELKKFVDRCNEWVEEAQTYITRKQQNRKKNSKAWRKGTSKANEIDDREDEAKGFESMQQLLKDADYIGFECQEIAILQEKVDSIKDFQRNARQALANILDQTTQHVEDLIEIGKSFPVEIHEIELLEKVAKQMKWRDRASDYSQPKSLEEVDELIDQASTLNVPDVNQHLLYLQDRKLRGEMWEKKAQELISVENVHYGQLDILSKQAADLPVTKETLATVDAFLKKQRDAAEQITKLYERTKNTDLRQRPQYHELNDLLASIADLSTKPAAAQDIERVQRRHEDWMRRGKRLFGKANAPLHILHQHLKTINDRNIGCLDLSDKPRVPVEPSSRQVTPEPDHEGGAPSGSVRDVFCLCRRPESGMMIECHICHEWYHSKCLKIARGKVKEEEDFTCPICDHTVKIPRDAARPKLEEMMHLQSEIPLLPFQPDEEETLDSIINVAQAFRDHMQQFIQPTAMLATQEEVPIMRFYLRKIEGADILLAEETNFFRQELYRFVPIAPQAPKIIEVSGSTRKPRPTKQQKLMVQFGVDNPDDLPVHVRMKTHGKRKSVTEAGSGNASQPVDPALMNENSTPGKTGGSLSDSRRDSSASQPRPHAHHAPNSGLSIDSSKPHRPPHISTPGTGGSGPGTANATPTSLNFREPLTASTYPAHQLQDQRQGAQQVSQQSAMFDPALEGTMAFAEGSGAGRQGGVEDEGDMSGLNPNLFDSSNAAGLAAFAVEAERLGAQEGDSGDGHGPEDATQRSEGANIFDPGSLAQLQMQGQGSHVDGDGAADGLGVGDGDGNMFADFTNVDDEHDQIHEQGVNVDPSLA